MAETATRINDESMAAGAPDGGLALVRHAASPRLRGVAHDYWGYAEQTAVRCGGGSCRRPTSSSSSISAHRCWSRNRGRRLSVIPTGGGFVAGLHETYALTETAGSQAGVELRLSPLGAYRLLGQSMDALANRSVPLDQICGAWAGELAERLQAAPTWDDRFAALDAALAARLADARDPSPEIAWAWRQLAISGGRVPIATLGRGARLESETAHRPFSGAGRSAAEAGCPAPALSTRDEPLLAATETPDWGALARQCGYYDQSHLIHEFQRFAGDTPDGLMRRRLATGGGFAAD